MKKVNMDLEKYYLEEDLFPREITSYEEREYGILFYNEENKDSYDSNHAVIYRDKISDLGAVLKDIIDFFKEKDITPNIYQSVSDEGYFEEIKKELSDYGFEIWIELQKYMVLSGENTIKDNNDVVVQRIFEWNDEYGKEIFEKAGEPWGIDVV